MTGAGRNGRLRWLAQVGATPCVIAGGLGGAHLLVLLLAGLGERKRQPPRPSDSVNLAVVIPAHDEEGQIARTVRSIQASAYPPARRRIVVIADNCTDRTAIVARTAGAEVWERVDEVRRGKGYALQWAFSRVLEDPRVDAVCVVDADCEISRNLLGAIAARLETGAEAVQAAYLIANPEASDAAALRWAGFALYNVVRPLGRSRLGLSSGLLGTGMAFSRRLLGRSPWFAFSFAEDREQHMRFVLDGARVEFVPEAMVRSPAPTAYAAGKAQAARWDSGRAGLARELTPRLLARGGRALDAVALDAALEPVLPPQSVLLGMNISGLLFARVARKRRLAQVATASMAAQVAYVLGGLAEVGAPTSVWRALVTVPTFVARRAAALSRSALGRGPSEWERTERETTRDREDPPQRGDAVAEVAGGSVR